MTESQELEEPQFEAAVQIIDAAELENLKNKDKKIEWILWLIKENWLENDKEFMDAITDAFDGIERDV